MKKSSWIQGLFFSSMILTAVTLSVAQTAPEMTSAAKLVTSSGKLKGEFPTLNDAFEAAESHDEVILLRDVEEDVDTGNKNGSTINLQLSGHRFKGALEIGSVWLEISPYKNSEGKVVPGKNRFEAGDLRSIRCRPNRDADFSLGSGVELDLTQTDVSGYFNTIRSPFTDAVITAPQCFERKIVSYKGKLHLVLDEHRQNFGYKLLPMEYCYGCVTDLMKPDGTKLELVKDENQDYRYTVPNVKIWDRWASGGICDLNDPEGWKNGVPGPEDLAILELSSYSQKLRYTNGVFKVAGLRIVMNNLQTEFNGGKKEDNHVTLDGTFNIGDGQGTLISDVNLTIQPGQVSCGKIDVGCGCSVTLEGTQTVPADISGSGRVNMGENSEITLTGNNSHPGGLIGPGALVHANRFSQIGNSLVIFGCDTGIYGAPCTIEIEIPEDTDDSGTTLPTIEMLQVEGLIHFFGKGIYTVPTLDFGCQVVNDLENGIRLAEPGTYTFGPYSGNGGFRLDNLSEPGVREVCFEQSGWISAITDITTLLRPEIPVTDGTLLKPAINNSSSVGSVHISGTFPTNGYAPMVVCGGVTFDEGAYWGHDVTIKRMYQSPVVTGTGTIGGDLIITDGITIPYRPDGGIMTVQGNLRVENEDAMITVEIPRNPQIGYKFMKIGGIEQTSFAGFLPEERFASCFTIGLDNEENPTAIVIKDKEPVAQIGANRYLSLAEAFASAPVGSQIDLLKPLFEDVTNTTPVSIQMNAETIYGSVTAHADLSVERTVSPDMEKGGYGANSIFGIDRDALTVGKPGIPDQNIQVNVDANLIIEEFLGTNNIPLRLHGGKTTYSGEIDYYGELAPVQSTLGGNADLVALNLGTSTKSSAGIQWLGYGTLDFKNGYLEGWGGIEAHAGTINLSGGTINAYYYKEDAPYIPTKEWFGSAIVILQDDPDFPVTLNVSGDVQLRGQTYSIYEKSVTEKPQEPKPLPRSLVADPVAGEQIWPRMNISGGMFEGNIYSDSFSRGMPGFISGGTFNESVNLTDQMVVEGYAAAPKLVQRSFKTVYPRPAGGQISLPEGFAPLTDSETAAIMSGIGKPAEGTISTEIRLSDGDPASLTNCLYLGIAPATEQDGNVQVASFASPKVKILHFDPTDGTLEAKLIPQGGTKIQSELPYDAVSVMATDDLSVPMVKCEEYSGPNRRDYLNPDTLGKFRLTRWDTENLPHFYRIVIQPKVPAQ